MANWNPKIPLDWSTVLLCFLAGTALSLPIGTLLPWIFFQPPSALLSLYGIVASFSWFVVPFWVVSLLFGRTQLTAYLVLIMLLVLILIGLLSPAINGGRVF